MVNILQMKKEKLKHLWIKKYKKALESEKGGKEKEGKKKSNSKVGTLWVGQ